MKYVADHHGGYIADVSFEGHAQYPPPSKETPFTVKPHHGGNAYKPPAPAPYH